MLLTGRNRPNATRGLHSEGLTGGWMTQMQPVGCIFSHWTAGRIGQMQPVGCILNK